MLPSNIGTMPKDSQSGKSQGQNVFLPAMSAREKALYRKQWHLWTQTLSGNTTESLKTLTYNAHEHEPNKSPINASATPQNATERVNVLWYAVLCHSENLYFRAASASNKRSAV